MFFLFIYSLTTLFSFVQSRKDGTIIISVTDKVKRKMRLKKEKNKKNPGLAIQHKQTPNNFAMRNRFRVGFARR